MNQQIIEKIINVINILNKIQIKGFDNIINLGLSIQELDNIIKFIDQNQQSDNKPKE